MDAGSVADWVNAGGTLCTFAGAVFAGVVALRSYRTQRAALATELAAVASEAEMRRVLDRRSQAGLVAVWAFRSGDAWFVDLTNGSALPIYALTVRVSGHDFDRVLMRGTQGPTPPRRSEELTRQLRSVLEESGSQEIDVSLECSFRDAAGRVWHRAAGGELVEVEPSFTFASPAP